MGTLASVLEPQANPSPTTSEGPITVGLHLWKNGKTVCNFEDTPTTKQRAEAWLTAGLQQSPTGMGQGWHNSNSKLTRSQHLKRD